MPAVVTHECLKYSHANNNAIIFTCIEYFLDKIFQHRLT